MTGPQVPAGHSTEGGVLVGRTEARRRLVLYEDPQCPHSREFEQRCGDLVAREVASGAISAEYRMRSGLGSESVRANNALALAAERDRFEPLRRTLFAHQPSGTGGFTVAELLARGAEVGLVDRGYVEGVQLGRFDAWVRSTEQRFSAEAPDGTPTLVLDGRTLEVDVIFDREALGAVLRA